MYTNIKHKFSKDLVPSILPLFKKTKKKTKSAQTQI